MGPYSADVWLRAYRLLRFAYRDHTRLGDKVKALGKPWDEVKIAHKAGRRSQDAVQPKTRKEHEAIAGGSVTHTRVGKRIRVLKRRSGFHRDLWRQRG